MFYHIELTHETLIHPIYFGADLMNIIVRKTYQEIEGTCPGHIGYIIAITSIKEIQKGVIVDNAMALYLVKYNALIFRPIKNEVLDGIIRHINKLGIFVDCGPMMCFISHNSLPLYMKHYPNEVEPCFKTDDGETIAVDDHIRLRILGVRIDCDKIFGIGTLADDYLGLIH